MPRCCAKINGSDGKQLINCEIDTSNEQIGQEIAKAAALFAWGRLSPGRPEPRVEESVVTYAAPRPQPNP